MADAHLSQQDIDSHFDSLFLGKVSAAKINAALAELPAPGKLVGVLSSEPRGLVAMASFGTEHGQGVEPSPGLRLRVTLSVDGSGLIDALKLAPVLETSWSQIDHTLASLAPNISFLAARVVNGSCKTIHQVASLTPRPLASEFKLFVLGALAHQIAAGHITWDQQLTVDDQTRSIGNPVGSGSLQFVPAGTRVSVRETATKMISISDNTAADMLINLVGQQSLESQVRQWSHDPQLDSPFLTTRQMILLHYANFPTLANGYLARASSKRQAYLNSVVDPLPLSEIEESTEPRDVDKIEWFGSPTDVCRAFVGLQRLSHQSRLSPVKSIFSVNTGCLGLHLSEWPTVWFKGGSEPGVLTLGYMATNRKNQTFVVSAMLSSATVALAPSATLVLLAAVGSAFGLVG